MGRRAPHSAGTSSLQECCWALPSKVSRGRRWAWCRATRRKRFALEDSPPPRFQMARCHSGRLSSSVVELTREQKDYLTKVEWSGIEML